MNYSDKTMMTFYQQLGKVFYAVAAIDKKVRKEELSALKKIMRSEWLALDDTTDKFGTDTAYQIEIVFDWLAENDWDIEQVLADLEDLKKEHPGLFTDKVNGLILKTASVIASSFSGKNQSELMLINKLKTILSEA